jgi:undecaprenyl pyrophosphate phosphatase UppP
MQFESKNKRNFWLNSILGMIPDVLIATLVAVYNDEGIAAFFFVLIGMQVVYLLIWIKNTIWDWVFFKYQDLRSSSLLKLVAV